MDRASASETIDSGSIPGCLVGCAVEQLDIYMLLVTTKLWSKLKICAKVLTYRYRKKKRSKSLRCCFCYSLVINTTASSSASFIMDRVGVILGSQAHLLVTHQRSRTVGCSNQFPVKSVKHAACLTEWLQFPRMILKKCLWHNLRDNFEPYVCSLQIFLALEWVFGWQIWRIVFVEAVK